MHSAVRALCRQRLRRQVAPLSGMEGFDAAGLRHGGCPPERASSECHLARPFEHPAIR